MLGATRKDPPLVVQFRVMNALLLRDIRTRFFGHGLGYLVALAWPLVHMSMLLVIYIVTGRVAPHGDSTLQFLAIAIVPVLSYMYMSRGIMHSVMLNKPLLAFPVVRFLDILLARTVLELATACLVGAILAAILFSIDVPIAPRDPFQATAAFAFTLLIGTGMGAINGIIVLRLPMWMIASILVNIIIYITSSILFMPSAFPPEIRIFFTWNPIMHAVEWMREAYYVDYHSVVLNKEYVMLFGAVVLVIALAIERGFRKFLMLS